MNITIKFLNNYIVFLGMLLLIWTNLILKRNLKKNGGKNNTIAVESVKTTSKINSNIFSNLTDYFNNSIVCKACSIFHTEFGDNISRRETKITFHIDFLR